MVTLGRKGVFRTATIVLDSVAAERTASERGRYDLIEVISHTTLSLPDFGVREKTTGIIDFLGSPEEIVASFGKTTRNEIARTQRDPDFSFVRHDTMSDEGYALYFSFEQAAGRVPYPRSRLSGVLEFLAYDKGLLSSGIFVYPSSPVLRIRSIFSARRVATDHKNYQRIGYATRRLVYDVCRFGLERGDSGLDLASINTTNAATRSISQFKESFNPRIVPEYHYTYRSRAYKTVEYIMSAARYVRRKLL